MRLEISGSQVEVRVPLGVFILNKLEATERSSAPRPSPLSSTQLRLCLRGHFRK